jgi:hypothetical protein
MRIMDSALLRDHEKLRSLMYPLVKDRVADPHWRTTDEFQLFTSPQYMDKHYPTPSARRNLLTLWQIEVDRPTLEQDHAELRKALYPRIEGLLDWLPAVRERSRNYRLYSDKTYFERCYPTHHERKEFIAASQREWKEEQVRTKRQMKRAEQFMRRLRDEAIEEQKRRDGEEPDISPGR